MIEHLTIISLCLIFVCSHSNNHENKHLILKKKKKTAAEF